MASGQSNDESERVAAIKRLAEKWLDGDLTTLEFTDSGMNVYGPDPKEAPEEP